MLTGPPISTAIIPPTRRPSSTAELPDKLDKKLLRPVLIAAIGIFTANIKKPVANTPRSGKSKIERIPSRARGIPAKSLRRTRITPPARKPPTRAPRKPEDTPARARVALPPEANGTPPKAAPLEAIAPATKPDTKPGFSAIE